MIIWLDLRFLKRADIYSNAIFKFSQYLIENNNNNINYNIYLDIWFSNLNFPDNSKKIIIKSKPWSIEEQFLFYKILKKDKNDLVIFFNYKKPIKYKNKFIMIISDLIDVYYPKEKNIFKKHYDNFILNNSCKNANKIICFNKQTKTELNDKFNINENKIYILKAFFYRKIINEENSLLKININSKYNINGEYFIYNAWIWNNTNLERILEVFTKYKTEKINLHLVILDDESINNITIRKKIIELNISDIIHFIWNVNYLDKSLIYKQSKWTIYPLLYDSFPFLLEEAINHNNRIISSNLDSIKEIFKDNINYFSQNNLFDIYEKILEFRNIEINQNYDDIFKEYNIEDFANNLIKIIK